MKWVWEVDDPQQAVEDGGAARYINIESESLIEGQTLGYDEDVWVSVHSWSDTVNHHVMKELAGRRVRVTVEVLP